MEHLFEVPQVRPFLHIVTTPPDLYLKFGYEVNIYLKSIGYLRYLLIQCTIEQQEIIGKVTILEMLIACFSP